MTTTRADLEAAPPEAPPTAIETAVDRLEQAETALLMKVEKTTGARYAMQGIRVDGPEFPVRMAALHNATQDEFRAADEWVSAKAALTAQLKQQED